MGGPLENSHKDMVREIRVTVSNGQMERLEAVKGDRSWREAVLEEFGVREEPEE